MPGLLRWDAFNQLERLEEDTHETYQQLVKTLRAMACLAAFGKQKAQPSEQELRVIQQFSQQTQSSCFSFRDCSLVI